MRLLWFIFIELINNYHNKRCYQQNNVIEQKEILSILRVDKWGKGILGKQFFYFEVKTLDKVNPTGEDSVVDFFILIQTLKN